MSVSQYGKCKPVFQIHVEYPTSVPFDITGELLQFGICFLKFKKCGFVLLKEVGI